MPKKKGMNRTAGTARRKMSASERVSYGLKTGAPLTGSASGVKSISLREAGEALTQGIVSARGNKLSFDPAGLAMALPLGKVAKAANALKAAGRIEEATAFSARLGAKQAGKIFGASERGIATDRAIDVGGRARMASEKVFKRLPDIGGDSPRLLRGSRDLRTFDKYADLTNEGAGRFKGKDDLSAFVSDAGVLGGMRKVGKAAAKAKLPKGGRTLQLPDNAEARFKAIDRTFSNLGAVRPAVPGAKSTAVFPKRVVEKLPEPGSVEMVKQSFTKGGMKITDKGAKNISRLLKGRVNRGK